MCIIVQASLFIHSLRLVGRRQGVSAIKCAAIDCLRPVVYDQISCSLQYEYAYQSNKHTMKDTLQNSLKVLIESTMLY